MTMKAPAPRPASFALHVPADPTQAVFVRRTLRAWLDGVGVPFGDAQDLVLAVDEAVTNAIEHSRELPQRGRSVDVDVHLERETDTVVVEVTDRGSWAGPGMGALHGGRGLMLMNALCDRVDIEHGDGTVVRLSRRPRPTRVLAPTPAAKRLRRGGAC